MILSSLFFASLKISGLAPWAGIIKIPFFTSSSKEETNFIPSFSNFLFTLSL